MWLRASFPSLAVLLRLAVLLPLAALSGCGSGGPYVNFSLSASQSTVDLLTGFPATPITINITRQNGYADTIKIVGTPSDPEITCAEENCTLYAAPGTNSVTFHLNAAAHAATSTQSMEFAATWSFGRPKTVVAVNVLNSDLQGAIHQSTDVVLRGYPVYFDVYLFNVLSPVEVSMTVPPGSTCLPNPCQHTYTQTGVYTTAFTMNTAPGMTTGLYNIPFHFYESSVNDVTISPAVTVVDAPPDFSLAATAVPSFVSAADRNVTLNVMANLFNSWDDNITVTTTLPSGFVCESAPCTVYFSKMNGWDAFGEISIFVPVGTPPGDYPIVFTGVATTDYTGTPMTVTHSTTAIVTVTSYTP